MNPHSVIKAAERLQVALDLLVAALLVVLVLTTVEDGESFVSLIVTLAVFVIIYVAGRFLTAGGQQVDAPRGGLWPAGVWICALVLAWASLLVLGTAALWLAFPLLFLEMRVLGPRRGLLAVTGTTSFAVAGALYHGLTPIGSILGPVFGAVVAVGVVLGFEAIIRESLARRRTIAELVRTRGELAAAERERATTAERERLAREIHDTLAQGFSSITLLLRAAEAALAAGDSAAALGRVVLARETAIENLDEARRVVRALTPAPLDQTTLVPALRRLVDQTRARSSIDWRMFVSGDVRELPLSVEATLLRVAQSAVANVRQHAQASRADLTLTFLDDSVALDVVDDGMGFDTAAPAAGLGGFGLPAMRARIAALGGSLSVESGPQDGRSGTALAVSLPLAVADADSVADSARRLASEPATVET